MKKLLPLLTLLLAAPAGAHIVGNPDHTGADGEKFIHPVINEVNCNAHFRSWWDQMANNYAAAHPEVTTEHYRKGWEKPTNPDGVNSDAVDAFVGACRAKACTFKLQPPVSGGWVWLGNFDGSMPCYDYWARLGGRRNGQITVSFTETKRYGEPKEKTSWPYGHTTMIDCRTGEWFWDGAWRPLIHNTEEDAAAQRFC